MSFAEVGVIISGANFVITWALAIYVYFANRRKATVERIDRLQTDIDVRMDDTRNRLTRLETLAHPKPIHDIDTFVVDLGNRLVAVENRLEAVPNHAHLERVHHRIDEVAGALKRLEGESASQTRILNLVYESLISDR